MVEPSLNFFLALLRIRAEWNVLNLNSWLYLNLYPNPALTCFRQEHHAADLEDHTVIWEQHTRVSASISVECECLRAGTREDFWLLLLLCPQCLAHNRCLRKVVKKISESKISCCTRSSLKKSILLGVRTEPLRFCQYWHFGLYLGACCWRSGVHRSSLDCKENRVVRWELDFSHGMGVAGTKTKTTKCHRCPTGSICSSQLCLLASFHIYTEENYIHISFP